MKRAYAGITDAELEDAILEARKELRKFHYDFEPDLEGIQSCEAYIQRLSAELEARKS
jgi:hypothetical protein